MIKLSFIKGLASNIRVITNTSGSVDRLNSGEVRGSISTTQLLHMRVGNVAVRFVGVPNISEGDPVRVVGIEHGELEALVIQNDATNLIYKGPRMRSKQLWIGFGVILLLFWFGAKYFVQTGFANGPLRVPGFSNFLSVSLIIIIIFFALGILFIIRKSLMRKKVYQMLKQ